MAVQNKSLKVDETLKPGILIWKKLEIDVLYTILLLLVSYVEEIWSSKKEEVIMKNQPGHIGVPYNLHCLDHRLAS
jgi:hypothetical protein